MDTKQKHELLAYFQQKAGKDFSVVCEITGMSFKVEAPFLPQMKGLIFSGLSPLASLDSALQLGRYSYSEAHCSLSASTLAGAILCILKAYNLRNDKLSAVEANLLLSQLPLIDLSRILSFLAKLSTHEKRRIPHLSLAGFDVSAMKAWLWAAKRAIDITDFEPVYKAPKLEPKGIILNSVIVETRKQARALLSNLKASSILPLKLQTIISISIQKNNLAMINEELRKNIIAGLQKLETPDSIALAEIFKKAGSSLTTQEAIVKSQIELSDDVTESFSFQPMKNLTLAEIIAAKKASLQPKVEAPAKTQQQIAAELLDMLPAIVDEVEVEQTEWHEHDCLCEACIAAEEASVEAEFLEDHDSLEAIQAEAQIEELDLDNEDSGYHITTEKEDHKRNNIDLSSVGEEF